MLTEGNARGVIGELAGCTREDSDANAISRRTRARHSLSDFSLDELEAILQVNEEDDYFAVDDEAEYLIFLEAIKAMDDDADASAAVHGTEDGEDDDLDEDDFDFEVDEALLALESEEDDDELGDIVGADARDEGDEGIEMTNRSAEAKRKQPPRRESKRLKDCKFGFAQRPLRPLVPVPKVTLSLRAQKSSLKSQPIVPRTMPTTQPMHGFTARQVGLLYCQIHEHVQLLVQVFAMSVMEPALSSVAAETHRMLDSILRTRDSILVYKTSAFPDFCFHPPFTQSSKLVPAPAEQARLNRGVMGVGFTSPSTCPIYFEGHVPYCGAISPPQKDNSLATCHCFTEAGAGSSVVPLQACTNDSEDVYVEEIDARGVVAAGGARDASGCALGVRKRMRPWRNIGASDGAGMETSCRCLAEVGEEFTGCPGSGGGLISDTSDWRAVAFDHGKGGVSVADEGVGAGQGRRRGWAPKVSGPVRTLLDVAPLAVMRDFFADISSAKQLYQEQGLCHEVAVSVPRKDREPMFAISSWHCPASATTLLASTSGRASPEQSRVGSAPSLLIKGVIPHRTAAPDNSRQHPTYASEGQQLGGIMTGVEVKRACPPMPRRGPSRIEGLVMVPHGIARAVARFRELFDPGLFPCQPPLNENPRRHLFTNAEDQLLAIGIEHFNSEWDKIHKRFLPSKTPKQIKIRVKNRCSKNVPFNCIKAIRQKKDAPLSLEERWAIDMALNQYNNDWHKVCLFAAPTRNPTTLQRLWKESRGIWKSWSQSERRKDRRRVLYSERKTGMHTMDPEVSGKPGEPGGLQASRPEAASFQFRTPWERSSASRDVVGVEQEGVEFNKDLFNPQEELIVGIDGMAASSAHAGPAGQENTSMQDMTLKIGHPDALHAIHNNNVEAPSHEESASSETKINPFESFMCHSAPSTVTCEPSPHECNPLTPLLMNTGRVRNHSRLSTAAAHSMLDAHHPDCYDIVPFEPTPSQPILEDCNDLFPIQPKPYRGCIPVPVVGELQPQGVSSLHGRLPPTKAPPAPVAGATLDRRIVTPSTHLPQPSVRPVSDLFVSPVPKFANFPSKEVSVSPLPAFKTPLPVVVFPSMTSRWPYTTTHLSPVGEPRAVAPESHHATYTDSEQTLSVDASRIASTSERPLGEKTAVGKEALHPRKCTQAGWSPEEPRQGVGGFRKVTAPLRGNPTDVVELPHRVAAVKSCRLPIEQFLNDSAGRSVSSTSSASGPLVREPGTVLRSRRVMWEVKSHGSVCDNLVPVNPQHVVATPGGEAASNELAEAPEYAGSRATRISEIFSSLPVECNQALESREEGSLVPTGGVRSFDTCCNCPVAAAGSADGMLSRAHEGLSTSSRAVGDRIPCAGRRLEVSNWWMGSGEPDKAVGDKNRAAGHAYHPPGRECDPLAHGKLLQTCKLVDIDINCHDWKHEGEESHGTPDAAHMSVVMDHEELFDSDEGNDKENEKDSRTATCEDFLGRGAQIFVKDGEALQLPAGGIYINLRLALGVSEGVGMHHEKKSTWRRCNQKAEESSGTVQDFVLQECPAASGELAMHGSICMEHEELEDSDCSEDQGTLSLERSRVVDNSAVGRRNGYVLEMQLGAPELVVAIADAAESGRWGEEKEAGSRRMFGGMRETSLSIGDESRVRHTYGSGEGLEDAWKSRDGLGGLAREDMVEFEAEQMLDSEEESEEIRM